MMVNSNWPSFRDWQVKHSFEHGTREQRSKVLRYWYSQDHVAIIKSGTKALNNLSDAFKQFTKAVAPIVKELDMLAFHLGTKTKTISLTTCGVCNGNGKRGNRLCKACRGSGRGKPTNIKINV